MEGKLHLILGSMYSGKSTKLINELKKNRAIGKNIFCINSKIDTRTPNKKIKTHDGIHIQSSTVEFLNSLTIPENIDVIGIDEAQFFKDLIPFVTKMNQVGVSVIVAGLDGDSNQEKFGNILDLIPIADSYEKVYSFCKICKDGTPGSFTKRISNTKNKILIGSDEHYIAVCKKHLRL